MVEPNPQEIQIPNIGRVIVFNLRTQTLYIEKAEKLKGANPDSKLV